MKDEPKYDRVVAYIRKSSEDNEDGGANKQLNSIEYQRAFVKEAERKYQLQKTKRVFEDDKSAYVAFERDNFEEMLVYLRENKDSIDGIICTEISRLARNFADGGMLLWYMQNGTIKRIYTPSKVFTDSSSDQMMVAIELAMSKKSSDDTGFRTKEGMKSKAIITGHPPRPAILGYKSEGRVGRKEWKVDPIRGPLVVRVFEQFATGKFNFDEIANYANTIGLTSENRKNLLGKIAKNTWVNRLQDPQYTGIFVYDDEPYVGQYEALISNELFERVKQVIESRKHPKGTHLDYAYSSGLITCGLCGSNLTGTHKKGITYYRCDKRKMPCKEKERNLYILEIDLENQLIESFEAFEIDQKTWEACKAYVIEINQPHKLDLKEQVRKLNEKIAIEVETQHKIGTRYARDELTASEKISLVNYSKGIESDYREALVKCENIVYELDDLMNKFLDNIKYVTKRLRIALPENKRELVSIFCENLVWKEGKLHWDWKKPYYIFVNQNKSSKMLPRLDSNQEPFD